MYDWAKLYYSVAGNYDRFNLKDFRLTTYAWQDYDSVCGAFYNGLCWLEEAL
jgi:hypothetical protein